MRFLRPFAALFGLGFLGILSLIPIVVQAAPALRASTGMPYLSDVALAAFALIQPTILLAVAVATGVVLHERVELTSHIAALTRRAQYRWPSSAALAKILALAALLATLVAAADLMFRIVAPSSFLGVPRVDQVNAAGRATTLLYGGITEELLMRFGLMTALVWAGLRLLSRRADWIVVAAILFSAFVFAAGHIPALVSEGVPDAMLIGRTILLNFALGAFFGWVYWRHSLELAMLAHAATHVVFWIVTPLLVAPLI